MDKVIAIDCETTGLNPHTDKLLGFAIAYSDVAIYYPFTADMPVPDVLRDKTVAKLGHNLRFDMHFLASKGITVAGPWQDTKLIATLIDENVPHGLKPLAQKYLGASSCHYANTLKSVLRSLNLDMSDLWDPRIDPELLQNYCCEDARNTLALYNIFIEDKSWSRDYYATEMLPTEQVLFHMEQLGNYIDRKKLGEAMTQLQYLKTKLKHELFCLAEDHINIIRHEAQDKARAKFKTIAKQSSVPLPEFNWNSPIHRRKLFYKHLGLGEYCTETTDTGERSLSKHHIEPCLAQIPVNTALANTLQRYFQLQTYEKMYSTYAVGISDRMIGNKIYGEYYQVSREDPYADNGGTVTGRLSHRNPNLGNLPRKTEDYYAGAFVKDLFIPPEGHVFISADYSQVELRVAAHLSQDAALLDVFNAGGDPHQQTADELASRGVNVTRQQAKTVNFLMIYGGSPWRLCCELGKDPKNSAELDMCEKIIDGFFSAHPKLKQWLQENKARVLQHGYVTSMFGLRRNLPAVWSWDTKAKKHALKQATNFAVQSAAASICKRAMIKLHAEGFQIVNQVHDSITCTCPDCKPLPDLYLKEISHIMCSVVELSVPLTVDAKISKTFI